MNRNQKAVQLYLSCDINVHNAKVTAEKHGVDRRDLSYLNNINAITTKEQFTHVCNQILNGNFIVTSSGERTKSLEMLVRILKTGSTVVIGGNEEMVLYLLESNSKYKIGVAKSISNRVRLLQTGNPYKITVFKEYKVQSEAKARELEKALHLKHSSTRLEGEWFSLTNEDLKEVDRYVNASK